MTARDNFAQAVLEAADIWVTVHTYWPMDDAEAKEWDHDKRRASCYLRDRVMELRRAR